MSICELRGIGSYLSTCNVHWMLYVRNFPSWKNIVSSKECIVSEMRIAVETVVKCCRGFELVIGISFILQGAETLPDGGCLGLLTEGTKGKETSSQSVG